MKTMGTNMNSDAFLIINQVKNKMKQPFNGEQFNPIAHKVPKTLWSFGHFVCSRNKYYLTIYAHFLP